MTRRSWMILTICSAGAAVAISNTNLASATATSEAAANAIVLAQAMIPPTGTNDSTHPMPMNERMERRFPQPVRVGDVIGLPVVDDRMSTLGHVRDVVRTSEGKIELIVAYSKWFGWLGWFTHAVAVPIEVVGIEGRQIASLDMPRGDYDAAPIWQLGDATVLPADASIRIALARN